MLLAFAIGFPFLVVGFAVAQPWWPVRDIFRDPLSVARDLYVDRDAGVCCYRYVGAISLFGDMLMAATAAMSLLTAVLRRSTIGRADSGVLLLALATLFSSVFAMDDLYRIHEGFYEKEFIGFYGLLLGAVVLLSRRHLGSFEMRLAIGAGVFFALSGAFDQFLEIRLVWLKTALEDGAKFFGICFWTAFVFAAGLGLIRNPAAMEVQSRRPDVSG